MKRNLQGDHKSNLNTSCASDLHSSLLSSLCQTNMNESLIKINELKLLYTETCHEEVLLVRENNQLVTMLDKLKKQLQILVDNKFGVARIRQKRDSPSEKLDQNKSKVDKHYKAGSIAKIKRQHETHLDQKNVKATDKIFRQPTFSNQKHDNYLQQKIKKDDLFQNAKALQPFRLAHRKTFSSAISSEQVLVKPNPNQKYAQASRNKDLKSGIMTQREEGEKALRTQKSTRKSYLNSPSASMLSSPRSTFVR